MNDEAADLVFGLAESAKMQLAAVEQATQAMQAQRSELARTITLMQRTQATIAAEAGRGLQQGISNIGTEVNASLRNEADKARATLGEIVGELRSTLDVLSWRWIIFLLVGGTIFGLVLGWMIWGMNISNRLDTIEQTLQQTHFQQQMAPAMPAEPARTHKQIRRGER